MNQTIDTNKEPLLLYLENEGIWITVKEYYDPTEHIKIPAEYKTDLASIPRIFWSVIPPYGLSERAPLNHDWFYGHAGLETDFFDDNGNKVFSRKVSKKEADAIFLKLMEEEHIKKWKRIVAYYAVHWFGIWAWEKHLRRNNEKNNI